MKSPPARPCVRPSRGSGKRQPPGKIPVFLNGSCKEPWGCPRDRCVRPEESSSTFCLFGKGNFTLRRRREREKGRGESRRVYTHIAPYTSYTSIYFHIPPYASKHPILGIWKPTWDPKIVISQPPERFQKWEFATMLPSMSPKGLVHPKGGQLYLFMSFKGSRRILQGWYE